MPGPKKEAVDSFMPVSVCMSGHGGGVLGSGAQAARNTSQRREYLS